MDPTFLGAHFCNLTLSEAIGTWRWGGGGCNSHPLSPCPAFISTTPQGISSKFGPAHKKDSPGSLEGASENALESRSSSENLSSSLLPQPCCAQRSWCSWKPPFCTPLPHAPQLEFLLKTPILLFLTRALKKKKPLDHPHFWSCLEKRGVCSHGFCPGCPKAPALHHTDGRRWGEGGDGRMGQGPCGSLQRFFFLVLLALGHS